ncbi:MAG: lipid II:glycine glycyltransferase FemX, partial [Bacteroidota bacterium]
MKQQQHNYTVRQILSQKEWDTIVSGFNDYSYPQSWCYSHYQAESKGEMIEYVAAMMDDMLIGCSAVRIKKYPLLGRIAYINSGPMMSLSSQDGAQSADPNDVLNALHEEYVLRRSCTMIISLAVHTCLDPEIAATISGQGRFQEYAFKSQETIVLDLRKTLKELRSGMEQKWRNQLNSAEKKEVTVEIGQTHETFERYSRLHQDMKNRKALSLTYHPDIFDKIQSLEHNNDKVDYLLAGKDGADIAGAIVSSSGSTSVYLFGATNTDGMKLKASYLLQWKIIEQAKENGKLWYDLGGINKNMNPGVYHFKSGLGGKEVRILSYRSVGFRSFIISSLVKLRV